MSMEAIRWARAVAAALFLVLLPAPRAVAQEQGLVEPRASIARREANYLRVNGVPAVLMWARGLESTADLDQYAALGLNTAYLRVTSASADALAQAAELASAAEERGLMIVIALAPTAFKDDYGNDLAIDAASDDYAGAVDGFVNAVVEGLGEHPRLVAWSVEAVPPGQVSLYDAGFVAYLREWYSSLSALNGSWGTEYADWSEIGLGAPRDIDSALTKGIGRASVDYAYYREVAYADALSLWAKSLRAADPGRLIFAGALTDYRSIISVRDDFDGMVLAAYPSLAEADWDTHNVHAVDIARRANRFAPVQTLEVGAGTTRGTAVAWAGLALAHGAAGVAFSSWPAVRASDELKAAATQIAGMARTNGYPQQPRAQAAVLYEPIAGGTVRNGLSLYGYLDGVTPNSPSNLFWPCRAGDRYGLVDVLRWDMLGDADLSQYGAVIAPMAFYLPDEAQVTLQNYVLRGGALVVDLGAGMYQADGVVTSMPEIMRGIIGLRYLDIAPVDEQRRTIDYGQPYNLAQPTPVTPLAPGQQGKEIDPALTRFVQSLELFLTRADVAKYLGDDFISDGDSGLRVNGLGKGFAVFAPFFLYEGWDSSNDSFNEFHDRILSRNSDLEMLAPEGIWPGVTATFYAGWSLGVASPDGLSTSVLAYGAKNQVYLVPGGVTRLYNAAETDQDELLFPGDPLARAVPLPIYLYPLDEGSAASVSVVHYGPDRIELVVTGSAAEARVRDGAVEMAGGVVTTMEIEIRSGLYPLSPASTHRVSIQASGPRRPFDQDLMPNADTGSLVIRDSLAQARITITPVD